MKSCNGWLYVALSSHCATLKIKHLFGHATVFAFVKAGSTGAVPCFNCSFVYSVYQWIHVSSMITKRRKSFELRLNSFKNCCEVASWTRLLSGASTNCVDSFLMPKILCRIRSMWSFEMPTVPEISCTDSRWSANIHYK